MLYIYIYSNKKKYKDLLIRYKILKSSFQVLQSLMYTLIKLKSGKHYKSLIIHKRQTGIYNINNRD